PLLEKLARCPVVAVNITPFQNRSHADHIVLLLVLCDPGSPKPCPKTPFWKSLDDLSGLVHRADQNIDHSLALSRYVRLVLSKPNIFFPENPAVCADSELERIEQTGLPRIIRADENGETIEVHFDICERPKVGDTNSDHLHSARLGWRRGNFRCRAGFHEISERHRLFGGF